MWNMNRPLGVVVSMHSVIALSATPVQIDNPSTDPQGVTALPSLTSGRSEWNSRQRRLDEQASVIISPDRRPTR
jgi:hypothetical protein